MIVRVVGMPRSGTAFVSMLFSLHPDILSYHELAYYDGKWRKTLTDSDADVTVDCNTYGFLEEYSIDAHVYIYIDYDPYLSAERSSIAIGKEVSIPYVLEVRRQGLLWAKRNNALIVTKSEVFTVHGLWKIWTYALGNVDFPEQKVKEMLKLNIQHHDPAKFKKCNFESDGTTGAYCIKCGRAEWVH